MFFSFFKNKRPVRKDMGGKAKESRETTLNAANLPPLPVSKFISNLPNLIEINDLGAQTGPQRWSPTESSKQELNTDALMECEGTQRSCPCNVPFCPFKKINLCKTN